MGYTVIQENLDTLDGYIVVAFDMREIGCCAPTIINYKRHEWWVTNQQYPIPMEHASDWCSIRVYTARHWTQVEFRKAYKAVIDFACSDRCPLKIKARIFKSLTHLDIYLETLDFDLDPRIIAEPVKYATKELWRLLNVSKASV